MLKLLYNAHKEKLDIVLHKRINKTGLFSLHNLSVTELIYFIILKIN